MPHVRRATTADVCSLAPRLRAEDAAEVRALTGYMPAEALAASFAASDIPLVMVEDDDTPVAMFGVGPGGTIWFLASDLLTKRQNTLAFLRQCRGYIEAFHQRHPRLWNVTDERNTLHHRWLKWCGFTVVQRHPALGYEGRPFLEVEKLRDPSRDAERSP